MTLPASSKFQPWEACTAVENDVRLQENHQRGEVWVFEKFTLHRKTAPVTRPTRNRPEEAGPFLTGVHCWRKRQGRRQCLNLGTRELLFSPADCRERTGLGRSPAPAFLFLPHDLTLTLRRKLHKVQPVERDSGRKLRSDIASPDRQIVSSLKEHSLCRQF